MKTVRTFLLAASLFGGFVITGCEVSHEQKSSPTLLGGTKTEDTKTTQNPITGQTDVQHTETKSP